MTTDSAVEIADDLQYRLGEGPCLSAAEQGGVFLIVETGSDPHEGRLSGSVLTDERNPLGGSDRQIDLVQDSAIGVTTIDAPQGEVVDKCSAGRGVNPSVGRAI